MMPGRPHPGHHAGIDSGSARATPSPPGPWPGRGDAGSTWWAPATADWWIGILFAIGSACFALGSLPGYVAAVGATADGTTYFVGSLFFTSAAGLQLAQAWRANGAHGLDWWAGAVQFAGTLFFNVSTFNALDTTLSASEADRRIWTPDARGSICFLVASALAWVAVCHGAWAWRPRSLGWLIAALNMVGSIAFGVSAVAGYVVPETEEVRNASLMNLGTFVGALCFLAGGLLLLPLRTRPEPP
jgi:hypothetical protein